MAAALMTLIQASFLQQESVDVGADDTWRASPEGLKQRTPFQARAALVPTKPEAVKPKAPAPAVSAGPTAESLQRLVAAVAKLSDTEQALGQAQQMKPAEDGEAQKWHQVSLTALEWTRNAQSQQVQVLLKDLKSVVLAVQPAVAERQVDNTSGRACARPPGVWHTLASSGESSAGEAEAKVHSVGSFAEETEEKENVPIGGSLRSDLEKIRDRDPGCCLIVRNIKRLGLESPELLREHFGRLSEVEEVCVAHSFEKPSPNRLKHRNGRMRPAALGFIVMATKEGAQKVIAEGNDQIVGKVCVNVRFIEPFADQTSQAEGSP